MATRLEIHTKREVYGWSTKVDFIVNSAGGFKDALEGEATLLWGQQYNLSIEDRKIHPLLEGGGATGYSIRLDATTTACEAEEIGKKLAYSLLSVGISKQWGITFAWQDSPLPCRVIDRTVSKGVTAQGFGSVSHLLTLDQFATELESHFAEIPSVTYRLLLSMELCSSSSFLTDTRSRLVMLVSAVEALADQKDLSDELGMLISELKGVVGNHDFSDPDLRNSIMGQVDGLKRESIRRATKRFLLSLGVSGEDIDFFDDAYGLRSKVVHEGSRIPELGTVNARLYALLVMIYSRYSELTLGDATGA